MSQIITSLKRRNEALQNECDALAQGVDNLSAQLTEAYQLLKQYEPDYVNLKLGIAASPAPSTDAPAADTAAA